MGRSALLLMLCCLLCVQNNYAQDFPDLKFSLLAPINDLPAGLVTAVYKDSRGLIWIGTENKGLLRYDGKKIKSYHSTGNSPNAIGANYINNICEDKQGWLWVGTLPGLYHFDPITERIETFLHDENDSNSVATNNKPVPFVDSKGRIWVSSSKGLQLFNTVTRKFSNYTVPPVLNPDWQLHAKGIGILYEDNKNNLWAASAYGLYLIDTKGLKCIPYFTGHYTYVSGISQDSNGQLWVGFWGGGLKKFYPETGKYIDYFKPGSVVKYVNEMEDDQHKKWICFAEEYFTLLDPVTGAYKYYKDENVAGRINGSNINRIYKDNEDRLWIMTNVGINIMDPRIQFFKTHSLLPAIEKFKLNVTNLGLPHGFLKTINGYFVSCWFNGFLYLLDHNWKVKKVIKKLSPLSSSNYPRINTIQYDDDGNTWYGTDSCLIKKSVNNRIQYFLPDDSFSSIDGRYAAGNILKRPDGLYWSRFWQRGLYIFDAVKGNFYKNYRSQYQGNANSMVYDREGALWLGTSSGLYRYDKNIDSFTRISFFKTKTVHNQFYNYVNDIYFDKNNTGWIATYYGLVKLSAKDKKIEFITDPQKPPHYVANRLLEDTSGTVWILSDDGLHAYNKKTNNFRYFTSMDGLTENFGGTIAMFNWANDSTIATGSLNSIISFNPYELNNNKIQAPIIFTDISIDEKRCLSEAAYNNNASIIATAGTKKISIHFAFPSYAVPQQNRLYYRLAGNMMSEWIETKDGVINLLDLPAGKYKLEVKAGSNGSIISNTYAAMNIIVKPFWYQTFLSKIMYALMFASGLYLFVRWRVNSVKSAAALTQKITETEMAALKAQMNPHFMFNCINSIDAFIQSNDKYNATLYLNKFAKLIRNVLDSSKQNFVAFSKDIETLKLYIELEELRSENKFSTTIDINEELMSSDYKVPALIIQPFVENAIIHGLRNKETNDGLLSIKISKTEQQIIYSVTDNGIGRTASRKINTGKEKSYGMEMSYDRIKLFNKETTPSVTITDLYENEKPAGTHILVKLNFV